MALKTHGKLAEAADECREALRLDPHAVEVHVNLGSGFEKGGHSAFQAVPLQTNEKGGHSAFGQVARKARLDIGDAPTAPD
jgi:hypothetical protein